MLWNLIWIVGIVVSVLVYLQDEGWDIGENIFIGLLGGVVGAFLTAICVFLLTCVIDGCSHKVYVESLNTPIYAKQDNYVTIENGNGAFKVYTSEDSNYMEMKQGITKVIVDGDSYVKREDLIYINDTVKWLLGTNNFDPKERYEIHIPKNVIATENKIN